MKALAARSYGPIEDLAVMEFAIPTAGPGQVLVRTEAAAVNAADVVLTTGVLRQAMPVDHPFVPGVDVSGVVEAVGEGVVRFSVGDPVLAWLGLGSGALAEYVVIDDTPGLALRPAGLDAARAAALATGGLTASSLVEAAGLGPGSTLLVVGATGGVGSFVVQLAKRAGATVLATGLPEDEDYLRDLGADEIVDYGSADVTDEALRRVPGGVDAVIDVVHVGPALVRSADAARAGGVVVFVLGAPPPAFERGVTAVYAGAAAPEGRLDELAAQVADGRLRVSVSADYPFADARQAIAAFAREHVRGKVTVTF